MKKNRYFTQYYVALFSYAGAMDFKDGAEKDEEYTYDANGNMTCDRSKGHTITPQEMVKKEKGKTMFIM